MSKRKRASSSNPKDIAALDRVPMHLLPAAGAIYGAMACGDGAEKYGPYNWRDKPISLMSYLGAIERHIACIKDGEDAATDSLIDHLGHINATTAILLDARQVGTLIDDRPRVRGRASALLEGYRDRRRAARERKRRPAS
ncbi:MAG TPA: DUF5664 domain-containing protein [Trueperaceae bacterium]|nr:DUF5664 domain-containing protein [Trueperaceae bacterium]